MGMACTVFYYVYFNEVMCMKIEIDISASESVEFIKLLSQFCAVGSTDQLAKEIAKGLPDKMNEAISAHRTVYNS